MDREAIVKALAFFMALIIMVSFYAALFAGACWIVKYFFF
jgi:hypothetical protein